MPDDYRSKRHYYEGSQGDDDRYSRGQREDRRGYRGTDYRPDEGNYGHFNDFGSYGNEPAYARRRHHPSEYGGYESAEGYGGRSGDYGTGYQGDEGAWPRSSYESRGQQGGGGRRENQAGRGSERGAHRTDYYRRGQGRDWDMGGYEGRTYDYGGRVGDYEGLSDDYGGRAREYERRGRGYGTGAGQRGEQGGFERGPRGGGGRSHWQGAWDQSTLGSHHQRGYGMDPSDYHPGIHGDDRNDWAYSGGGSARRQMPKGYQRSDERIREDVCERLSHSGMDVSDVSVSVSEGHVTLEGTVDDRRTKHAIENCADDCLGVQDVENRIRVARAGQEAGGQQGSASSSGAGVGGTATGSSGIGADPKRGGTGKASSGTAHDQS